MNVEENPLEESTVQRCQRWYQSLRAELSKVIVGQEEVLQQVIVAILAQGHALLEGLPGLAKTLLVQSLAEIASLRFQRIQFSPDLAPADLAGMEIAEAGPENDERGYRFVNGPLFANLILADEIALAPPKTQATMFDAMQTRRITVGGKVHVLPEPFFVLATQNPLENHDRRLRDAQLDRFLLMIQMDYPSGAEEWEIAQRAVSPRREVLTPQLSADELLVFQQTVVRVAVSNRALGYAWNLVRATRPTGPEAPEFVYRWLVCGAGPRGLVALVRCAQARALLHGRVQVAAEDVEAMALPALRHRVLMNQAAEANALTSDRLLRMIMQSVPPDAEYQPLPASDSLDQESPTSEPMRAGRKARPDG